MNTFHIDTINKTVNFKFNYNKELKDLIKDLDYNVRFNSDDKEWIVPVNNFTKNTISNIIKKYNFKQIFIKTEDVKFSYKKSDVDYAYLKGRCDAKNFLWTPRQYQYDSLSYALEKGSHINGDAVGVGKTAESIFYTEVTDSFPCLLIAPDFLKEQWKNKWEAIVGKHRTISIINAKETKKKPNIWDSDVVIINYDILGKKQGTGTKVRFKELLEIDWKMAICDEAHYLKERTSGRSKAAKNIFNKEGLIIQLLTGTAIKSKPVELWNLLKLIKKDHLIADDWFTFIKRYCGGYKGKFGWVKDGATNILELNKLMRETCYIRREKKEVLKDLPDVIKQVINIPITNTLKINKANNDILTYLKENISLDAMDKAMEAEHLVKISVLRKLSIEGKLKAIEKYITNWKNSSDEKLVIFGVHREPLNYLANKFNCDLIIGGVSSSKKNDIVNNWQKNDKQFLFCNIDAGGTGVDGLQNVCSNMAIIELPRNFSDIEQVIGRIHRSGQKDTPNVNFLLSEDTIDKQIWEVLQQKEQVAEAVNKGIDVKRNKGGLNSILNKLLKKTL